MEQLTQQAQAFIREVWRLYLEQRDISRFDEIADEQISWIGTGEQELCHNQQDALRLLRAELSDFTGRFLLERLELYTMQVTQDVCVVYGFLDAREDGQGRILAQMSTRFSSVVRRTPDGGMRLCHIHQSVSDASQEPGEFYPKQLVEQSNALLKKQLREKTRELELLSQQDSLTGIFNRKHTENAINACLLQRCCGALLMIDIDNFKAINDSFGHLFGDKVLVDIAQKLRVTFRAADVVGRVGGDEFLTFMAGTDDPLIVRKKAEELICFLKRIYRAGGRECRLSGTIGIALAPRDGSTFNQLFVRADAALYQVKRHGKNGFAFFERNMEKEKHWLDQKRRTGKGG